MSSLVLGGPLVYSFLDAFQPVVFFLQCVDNAPLFVDRPLLDLAINTRTFTVVTHNYPFN
jgi:hypothetical protein